MKIAFHTGQFDLRGTCVSLYDYAHYHETILGGKSVILTSAGAIHDEGIKYKFAKRFEVRYYKKDEHVDFLVQDCDIFYTIKYGKNDTYLPKGIKTCIHCVFDLSEPHGDVYAAVSDTLAKKFGQTLFVPHMIGLKPSRSGDNLRKKLGIPQDAVVFGRHGGQDTFDLVMAKIAISHVVNDRTDSHFVFVNTPRFISHPRVHHIEKIIDMDEKNRFIMTCDAHLECGSLGHTFGISIGEFSINNKPVILYNGPVWNTAHFDILKEKGIYFKTEDELYNVLLNFNPKDYESQDMNCYKQYSPEKVMKQFKSVFIDQSANIPDP